MANHRGVRSNEPTPNDPRRDKSTNFVAAEYFGALVSLRRCKRRAMYLEQNRVRIRSLWNAGYFYGKGRKVYDDTGFPAVAAALRTRDEVIKLNARRLASHRRFSVRDVSPWVLPRLRSAVYRMSNTTATGTVGCIDRKPSLR